MTPLLAFEYVVAIGAGFVVIAAIGAAYENLKWRLFLLFRKERDD